MLLPGRSSISSWARESVFVYKTIPYRVQGGVKQSGFRERGETAPPLALAQLCTAVIIGLQCEPSATFLPSVSFYESLVVP